METSNAYREECEEHQLLQERLAVAEAETALAYAELRALLERRMADGLDVTPLLDAWSAAGIDVPSVLFE